MKRLTLVVSLLGLALAAPGVHVSLSVDQRRSLDLPPAVDHLERARAALGRRGKGLVRAAREEEGLSIEACLGPPTASSRTQPAGVVAGVPSRARMTMSSARACSTSNAARLGASGATWVRPTVSPGGACSPKSSRATGRLMRAERPPCSALALTCR